MHKDSIPLTGFCSHTGQYVFLRMPFGLKNAPSTFQRAMHKLFHDYIGKFVLVYIDDIIVYSNNKHEH